MFPPNVSGGGCIRRLRIIGRSEKLRRIDWWQVSVPQDNPLSVLFFSYFTVNFGALSNQKTQAVPLFKIGIVISSLPSVYGYSITNKFAFLRWLTAQSSESCSCISIAVNGFSYTMLNKSQSFQQDATTLLPYFSSLVSIAPWQNVN